MLLVLFRTPYFTRDDVMNILYEGRRDEYSSEKNYKAS
uniref:Uncharacterized protein n=1 Tax=Lepeophtheirus salmonis TaxID=72036 RepID=A0A0K2VKQ5_LEPSM